MSLISGVSEILPKKLVSPYLVLTFSAKKIPKIQPKILSIIEYEIFSALFIYKKNPIADNMPAGIINNHNQ